jgi:parallel beta-helix repeat protein
MRRGVLVLLGLTIALAVLSPASKAKTYRVPQDYEKMNDALWKAGYGDTVLVSPGLYLTKAKVGSGVSLISTHGPDSTVLWGRRFYILMLIDCDLATTVSGFTFDGRGANACIACTTGAPVITNNVLRDSWDGINLYRSNPLVQGNVFTGCNRAIHMDSSNPEVVENDFRKNGDALSLITSGPVIAGNTFEHNGKAILIQGHSYPLIGGSLEAANDLLQNGTQIYNSGLRTEGTLYTADPEVAIATHNYWGTDCPTERRIKGEVLFRPWVNAAHDSVLERCPEPAVPEGSE